jgi:GT2 family glycosyltransferase
MTPPRSLLITVSEARPAARSNLRAFLGSLVGQGAGGEIVLVMRGGGSVPAAPAGFDLHSVHGPAGLSSSQSRNLGLAHAEQLGLLDAVDLVAFPDDDVRYPPGLLARVHSLMVDGSDLACGLYAPDAATVDRRRFPAQAASVTPRLVVRAASCSTVFLSARGVRAVGRFDERFGLGACYGSSEDTDYALRAVAAGLRGVYEPSLLVEHPYKPSRPVQYYRGNVAVLAKHGRRGGTGLLLVRRLASGIVLTTRGLLPAAALADVVRSAARLLAEG